MTPAGLSSRNIKCGPGGDSACDETILNTHTNQPSNMQSNDFGHAPSSSASSRKVAIPRLKRLPQEQNAKSTRRVSRACTACRNHKIRCSGDTPQCKHCQAKGRDCSYSKSRRDRLKTVLRWQIF
ncbi:hypothetical protein BS50DRAFT_344050 [Corynespora cassiicola Philippines]|uniref:Zn(2)-C6 fungal-type domain-containing protein n=1 Tax=Corynespora cassiicola Philippines TaxID=1448308 RepID=A0A2T2N082_CORCC|nr:hypothetical protein BS50DRAFT_344050 [Corynespora cassiicola Philippines]